MLDYFALLVLLVLLFAVIALWVILGMLPGKIARQRNHPQADAITVCGWWGVITLGLLYPIAFIWAYTRTSQNPAPDATESSTTVSESNGGDA